MEERTWHLRRPEGQLDCQLTIVSPVLSQMHILLSPFSTTTTSLGHSELPSCSQTGFQNTPVPINASPQESTSPSPTSNPSRHLHPHPITQTPLHYHPFSSQARAPKLNNQADHLHPPQSRNPSAKNTSIRPQHHRTQIIRPNMQHGTPIPNATVGQKKNARTSPNPNPHTPPACLNPNPDPPHTHPPDHDPARPSQSSTHPLPGPQAGHGYNRR
jgi:hypothetical protein